MNGTQAIDRALYVLSAFDDHNPTLSLTDLVERLELNKTTVFRILTALENAGYVQKTDAGDYRLGSELIALGGRAARANPLRQAAHDPLRDLTRETGETTTLEIPRTDPDGHAFMLVIDEALGKHLVGITQYIGTRLPIHATSTGKAVLAHLPPDDRAAYLQHPLHAITERTHTDAGAFADELRIAGERGYALVGGELEEGLVAVGAPIFNHAAQPIAAISLVGPSVRLSRSLAVELAPVVIHAAHRISHALGYRVR